MNKFIAVLSCVLALGVFMHTSEAQSTEDNCALYGGSCATRCMTSYRVDGEAKLCTGLRGQCCNPYPVDDRCKSRGGQCEAKCRSENQPRGENKDCKALGMECCIYV